MAHFEVVVCGLGVTGSAALYQLARRGVRVLGLERFRPGHELGSSHGETRIIRLGYFEHPSYVPLVQSAYAGWREIEAAAGRRLLHVTGIVEIGPPADALVSGTLTSSRQHGLRHEILTAAELMRRFPAFRVPSDSMAVVQPEGGFLEAEPSVEAMVSLAPAIGDILADRKTVG
jgi:sarcosine oxidase